MAASNSKLMKFIRVTDLTWESRRRRTFLATITKNLITHKYNCTVDNGGGNLGDFNTLRNAKNAFRKFLHDKPVIV